MARFTLAPGWVEAPYKSSNLRGRALGLGRHGAPPQNHAMDRYCPVNFAGRFCRNACTPSKKSRERPARRCACLSSFICAS